MSTTPNNRNDLFSLFGTIYLKRPGRIHDIEMERVVNDDADSLLVVVDPYP